MWIKSQFYGKIQMQFAKLICKWGGAVTNPNFMKGDLDIMEFKITILILMVIFYACYFIKMISQKKQGISTDQLGKGKTGFVKVIEISLKVTTYLLPVIQVISILTISNILPFAIRIAGVIITLIGVLVFIVSVLQMKDNWRAGVQRDERTTLVIGGIYSISRNPAFLGFDLMYIGILMAFFRWYLLVATTIALILFHLQIVNVEEEFLLEAFGEEYLTYKKKVCRYLGRKI